MRNFLLAASVFAVFGSAAFADDVEVAPAAPGVVIERHSPDESSTTTKTVHRDDGCTTHSVTHADNDSTVTRSKTEC
jgi:hypothetical protein